MSIFDNLSGLLKDVSGGNASATDIHGAFDQVAQAVPSSSLAQGLAHAFNSDQTPPFENMISDLFSQSTPEQKAGLLNKIIRQIGPAAAGQMATSAGLGSLAAAISSGAITPQQAQQVSPDNVQVLAQQAAKKNPSIVDAAAGFYAQHPTLVKTIGAGALALLMSKVSQARTA